MEGELPQQEVAKQKDYGNFVRFTVQMFYFLLPCLFWKMCFNPLPCRLYAKFKRTGSMEDNKNAMATATSTVVTDGAKQVVDDFFAADSTRSVRRAAEMLGIKRASLHGIMKELELLPYKIQIT